MLDLNTNRKKVQSLEIDDWLIFFMSIGVGVFFWLISEAVMAIVVAKVSAVTVFLSSICFMIYSKRDFIWRRLLLPSLILAALISNVGNIKLFASLLVFCSVFSAAASKFVKPSK